MGTRYGEAIYESPGRLQKNTGSTTPFAVIVGIWADEQPAGKGVVKRTVFAPGRPESERNGCRLDIEKATAIVCTVGDCDICIHIYVYIYILMGPV